MRPFSIRENHYDSFKFQGINQTSEIRFKRRKEDGICAIFKSEEDKLSITTSYFIGADWIPGFEEDHWIYVESKLNTRFDPETGKEMKPVNASMDLIEVDVINMLFQALQEPEVRSHTQELFEIKFDREWIPLSRKQDLISPLIMIQFLSLVKDIVRKGLKKSYYKVEENLHSKVKGKVLVGQTIKKNLVKNKMLNTVCQYEEFGVNALENRILKKTLSFIRRYMNTFKGLGSAPFFQETFNYIQPAFEGVTEEVSMNDIKHIKFNSFYKNYKAAIELAKLILKRFSYNLNSIQEKETILTPPYWIDMSKLFELYVLSKLKERYKLNITYHPTTNGNELDYLLKDGKNSMVIDAKYKPNYRSNSHPGLHDDIRQVSGYARLKKIRELVGISNSNELLDCLIIYPDQNASPALSLNLRKLEIPVYEKIYKSGIRLPILF